MKTYKAMTLGDLIDALKALDPAELVQGIGTSVHSYRGYYERNAIAPIDEAIYRAADLAKLLSEEIGNEIHGWKGGDYIVEAGEAVYLADHRDTGPNIIGLEKDPETGYYTPVLLEQSWLF